MSVQFFIPLTIYGYEGVERNKIQQWIERNCMESDYFWKNAHVLEFNNEELAMLFNLTFKYKKVWPRW